MREERERLFTVYCWFQAHRPLSISLSTSLCASASPSSASFRPPVNPLYLYPAIPPSAHLCFPLHLLLQHPKIKIQSQLCLDDRKENRMCPKQWSILMCVHLRQLASSDVCKVKQKGCTILHYVGNNELLVFREMRISKAAACCLFPIVDLLSQDCLYSLSCFVSTFLLRCLDSILTLVIRAMNCYRVPF